MDTARKALPAAEKKSGAPIAIDRRRSSEQAMKAHLNAAFQHIVRVPEEHPAHLENPA